MKTITLQVTCKYDVEITREVSDEVYKQLCDIYDSGGSISDGSVTIKQWIGLLTM